MTRFTASYEKYMRSAEWRHFRLRYFASGMPTSCLACQSSERITLHHITYARLKRERFTDVVPLCWDCHKKLHEAGVIDMRGGVVRLRSQLQFVFGLSKKESFDRTAKWQRGPASMGSRQPPHNGQQRKLSKHEKRRLKRLAKVRREMDANRTAHERMCD